MQIEIWGGFKMSIITWAHFRPRRAVNCKLSSVFSSNHPLHLQVAYDQMTGGSEDELWEGENLVYRCKNDTLVLNDDPDMVKVQCNNNIRMIVTHLYST